VIDTGRRVLAFGPTFVARGGTADASPDFETFCELGRTTRSYGLAELVADSLTPSGPFVQWSGRPGFLLESVEHGERWSRFSFVGRSPAATMVARGRRVEVTEVHFQIPFA